MSVSLGINRLPLTPTSLLAAFCSLQFNSPLPAASTSRNRRHLLLRIFSDQYQHFTVEVEGLLQLYFVYGFYNFCSAVQTLQIIHICIDCGSRHVHVTLIVNACVSVHMCAHGSNVNLYATTILKRLPRNCGESPLRIHETHRPRARPVSAMSSMLPSAAMHMKICGCTLLIYTLVPAFPAPIRAGSRDRGPILPPGRLYMHVLLSGPISTSLY